MDGFKSLQENECYKFLNKRENCSKCNIAITQNIYRKGRTVCNLRYNHDFLPY